MCRKKTDVKIKCIPLSANIFRRHIENIAEDGKKQALEEIMQCARFSTQLDGSTDTSNMSQLKVFARCYFNNKTFFSEPPKKRSSKDFPKKDGPKKIDSAKWMSVF